MKRILTSLAFTTISISAFAAEPNEFQTKEPLKNGTYAGCDQIECDFYNNSNTFTIKERDSNLRVSSYSNSPNQVQGVLFKNLDGGGDIRFSKEEILGRYKKKLIPIGEYKVIPLTNHDINSPHFSAFFIFWEPPRKG